MHNLYLGNLGNPKGVILSHGGILSNCEGAFDLLKPLIKKKGSDIFNVAATVSLV